ncbi:hypothetical protein PSENEW3n2_00000904 [Picochlorum sp. SENEW3]|nr:hypothetical protein PSENEW3n2_00000904 [Picochlorum sp. SENEW3]WPT14960.1 hypothetical protein PSENEW3_00000904 [Picochlorum sp. SENEW3]
MGTHSCVDSDGLVEPIAPGQLENLMKGKIIRRTVLKCERSKCTRPSKRKKRSRNVSKKDISCPHRVELLVFQDHPGEVYAIETAPHSGHGREEPRYQPLTENLKQYIQEQALLNIGPKTIISNVLKLASESKYRRFSFDETRILTTNKVDNFIRRVRNSRMVHSDDAVALDLMAMDPKNIIVHYDRQADQIVLVLCSDFQAAMLDKFGDAVFLDTVHGQTNKGLYQLTMLVVSETGKGVPVAYCLSNFEKAEHWSLLVEKAFNKTKRKPKDSIFMSDDCVKIKKCIGDMKGKHLLCWFHMMQAIDRRLSSYGGATKRKRDQDIVKAARSAIKYKIRDLQRAPDFEMYKKKVQEFYQWLLNDERIHQAMGRRHTKLPFGDYFTAKEDFKVYFESTWDGVGSKRAPMWARFGRIHANEDPICWHAHDTNNMIESYFCQQKHFLSKSVRTQRVSSHVQFLNNTVIPWYIHDRQQMVDGIIMSRQQKETHTMDWTINWLRQSRDRMSIIDPGIGLGRAIDPCDREERYIFCLADMSCTCPGPHAMPCIHLEAASASMGVTVSMLKHAAKMIKEDDLISRTGKVVEGLHKCKKISSFLCAQKVQAWFKQDKSEDRFFCECFLFRNVGVCSHLIAVEDYIEIEGLEGDEELLKPGVVKAFRPSCLMDVENDPSKRFDTELHPHITDQSFSSNATFYEDYIREVRRLLSNADSDADLAYATY